MKNVSNIQVAFADGDSIGIYKSTNPSDVGLSIAGNRPCDGIGGRPALEGTLSKPYMIMSGVMRVKTLKRLYMTLQKYFEEEAP